MSRKSKTMQTIPADGCTGMKTVRLFLEEKVGDPAESGDIIAEVSGEVSHEVQAAS